MWGRGAVVKGAEAYDAFFDGALSHERKEEAAEVETIRAHFAELVRLRAEVCAYLEAHGNEILAARYTRMCRWFEQNVVHRSYTMAPRSPAVFDHEAVREAERLTGTEREWMDDLRDNDLTYPFPWEA